MPPNIVIKVSGLTKIYKLYNSPVDRLKESLNPFRKKYHRDFYALNNISFEIEKGETVGIVGKNGAGKSTLLKILTGVLAPTSGNVTVNGRISALLELGAGFNPELSGIENVYFSGILMGYTRDEINERLDNILSFADIGEFARQPVKTYSSGMFVRLAFSVAINVAPEILIVDEALSVGDAFFQAKCMAKMKKMIDDGVTLLFVSHDTISIKSLCHKAILLKDGIMVADDTADKVVDMYVSSKIVSRQLVIKNDETRKVLIQEAIDAMDRVDLRRAGFKNNKKFLKHATFERIRNGKADFVNVQLLDEFGNELESIEYGQRVILRMYVEVREDIHALGCGYHIKTKNGISIVNSNLHLEDKLIMYPKKGDRYCVDWKFQLCMMEGIYNIQCVMSVPINVEFGEVDFCDYIPCALQFVVQKRMQSKLYGYVHLDSLIEINKI